MLEVVRTYKNSSGDLLRVDSIQMERTANTIARYASEHTFARRLRTTWYHGPADRDINLIEIVGNYDTIETSSGNFLWATWTSPSAQLDMSDLPQVGETI